MARLQHPRAVEADLATSLTLEVLEGLDAYVHTEHFLHRLEQAKTEWMDLSGHDGQQMPIPPSALHPRLAAKDQGGCEMVSLPHAAASGNRQGQALPAANQSARPAATAAALAAPQGPAAAAADPADDFVVLAQDDAIEAMGYYIALYISRMPEAKTMESKQLQAALTAAFKVIRRSRFRLVWDWGRWLYRWSAVGYSAVSLYENPWLIRAVVSAIWAASKVAFGHLW